MNILYLKKIHWTCYNNQVISGHIRKYFGKDINLGAEYAFEKFCDFKPNKGKYPYFEFRTIPKLVFKTKKECIEHYRKRLKSKIKESKENLNYFNKEHKK